MIFHFQLKQEERLRRPDDPSLNIMQLYLGQASPHPSREKNPPPLTGLKVRFLRFLSSYVSVGEVSPHITIGSMLLTS